MKNWKKVFALLLGSVMALSVFAGCGDSGSNDKNDNGGNTPTTPDNPDNPDTPDNPDNPDTPQPPQYDVEAPAFEDVDATLSLIGGINKTDVNHISPDLFGLFLEDINYAGYALDDNLVCNGSFEYSKNRTQSWVPRGLTVKTVNSAPLFADAGYKGYYAQINATAGGTLTNSGYRWVPMSMESGVDYIFSCFIKGYGGEITVTAKNGGTIYAQDTFSVAERTDWVKYERTITATRGGSENISLEISFGSADTDFCLDAVKFETTDSTVGFKNYMYNAIKNLSPAFFRFPGGCVIEGTSDTEVYDWKNSVGAVAGPTDDTVPEVEYTLVRDGETTENFKSRGEQAARKPNTDLWQGGENYYDLEYGIGFYEFFELCDSLGAKAIPIVNCGLTCQIQQGADGGTGKALSGRHGKGVEDFIQDALDLVAFAKGDPDSSDPDEAYWAQLRADMGHPDPFEMDYLGIGNEQWGTYFTGNYEKFLEAFTDMAKENPLYGSVRLIVGNGPNFQYDVQFGYNPETGRWAREGTAQKAAQQYISKSGEKAVNTVSEYGVVDHHYYMNYTDFLEVADMYDDYLRKTDGADGARNAYDVFVGEYAANTAFTRSEFQNGNKVSYFPQVKNSWRTALSEAAFMTGLERNGDIVKLAAYAPMFGTYGKPLGDALQWETDMMFFTNDDVSLTPNYFVQQIFMQNAGDYKLASRIRYKDDVVPQTVYTGNEANEGDTVRPNTTTTRTFDDIYYLVSYDEETEEIIVKIVNVGEKQLKFNVYFNMNGIDLLGVADVISLSNPDPDAVSDLDNGEAVRPVKKTIGGFTDGKTFGYTVSPYSVTVFRLALS